MSPIKLFSGGIGKVDVFMRGLSTILKNEGVGASQIGLGQLCSPVS